MIARFPMTREHFELIEPDPVFSGFKARMPIDVMLAGGKSMAWVDGPDVLCIGGYVIRRPGVAWMWFLPSRQGSRMLLRMARFFQRWVATLEDGIRIEATVLADFPEGNRFATLLGLERETAEPMRLWDGHCDYHLYARVIGEQHDEF